MSGSKEVVVPCYWGMHWQIARRLTMVGWRLHRKGDTRQGDTHREAHTQTHTHGETRNRGTRSRETRNTETHNRETTDKHTTERHTTERQRQRDTHRDTQRHTQRDTRRDTDREQRDTYRDTDTERYIHREAPTERQTQRDIQRDRHACYCTKCLNHRRFRTQNPTLQKQNFFGFFIWNFEFLNALYFRYAFPVFALSSLFLRLTPVISFHFVIDWKTPPPWAPFPRKCSNIVTFTSSSIQHLILKSLLLPQLFLLKSLPSLLLLFYLNIFIGKLHVPKPLDQEQLRRGNREGNDDELQSRRRENCANKPQARNRIKLQIVPISRK